MVVTQEGRSTDPMCNQPCVPSDRLTCCIAENMEITNNGKSVQDVAGEY